MLDTISFEKNCAFSDKRRLLLFCRYNGHQIQNRVPEENGICFFCLLRLKAGLDINPLTKNISQFLTAQLRLNKIVRKFHRPKSSDLNPNPVFPIEDQTTNYVKTKSTLWLIWNMPENINHFKLSLETRKISYTVITLRQADVVLTTSLRNYISPKQNVWNENLIRFLHLFYSFSSIKTLIKIYICLTHFRFFLLCFFFLFFFLCDESSLWIVPLQII